MKLFTIKNTMLTMALASVCVIGHRTEANEADFKFKANCPTTAEVQTFLSDTEFAPEKIIEDMDNFLNTVPNDKKIITTSQEHEGKTVPIRWKATAFIVTLQFPHAAFPITAVHLRSSLSPYSSQEQLCGYSLTYTSTSIKGFPTAKIVFTRQRDEA